MNDNKKHLDGAAIREEAVRRGDELREAAVAYAGQVMARVQGAPAPTATSAAAPTTVDATPDATLTAEGIPAVTTETAGV